MADEYRLDEVFKAKMTAAARHREATREAHNVFSEGPMFTRTRGAQPRKGTGRPSGRAELHRAIKVADEAYHTELARLGQDILSWFGRFLFATAGQFCRSAIGSTS